MNISCPSGSQDKLEGSSGAPIERAMVVVDGNCHGMNAADIATYTTMKVGQNLSHPLQPPSTNGETCVSTWLHRDIVVKVLDPGEWFGKKGIIKSVVDDQAIICFPDSDQQVEFHDRSLETVIPKPGGKVLILSGSLRGTPAVIRNIDVDNYSTSIETLQGVLLERIPYESVSRLWEQTSS